MRRLPRGKVPANPNGDERPHRIVCWDLEIATPVEEQLDGWEAARRGDCGISALVLSDSETGRFHIYDKHTVLDGLAHLNSADLLVGWNTLDFDSRVIQGVTGEYITVVQYDMLQAAWRGVGFRQKGWKLTQVAERALGLTKNGHGEYATALAARGAWGSLFDYCLNDVHLVRQLYNKVVEQGWLPDPEGNEIHLDVPIAEFA